MPDMAHALSSVNLTHTHARIRTNHHSGCGTTALWPEMVINNRSITDLLIASRGCQIMNLIKTSICPLGLFALFSLNNTIASATRFDQAPQGPLLHSFVACFLLRCLPFAVNAIPRPRVAPWSLRITSHASLSYPGLPHRWSHRRHSTQCPQPPPATLPLVSTTSSSLALRPRLLYSSGCCTKVLLWPRPTIAVAVDGSHSVLNLVDVPGCPPFPRCMPRLSRYPAPESVGPRREW